MHAKFIATIFAISTATVTAAPVPIGPAAVGAAAVTTVGVVCAFQGAQCQAIGDGVKGAIADASATAGAPKLESIKTDGGIGVAIGDIFSNLRAGYENVG
ncbi:hypothetical protein H072_4807 [Dactylellina haptotyla CBS 200.50]|uniref:Uncharacterized protein n=1 Tax=Dactylellina haptotyla (strain CBS 200.50) TaxID=1284197 RepID=S8AE24_DACHA|nr:hypothetical protein H072_4807 [Dactylellina haptotyla CBS 200.50]